MAANYEHLRSQHQAALAAILPAQVDRLDWSAALLREERTRRLRELISTAKARSRWHAERLAGVDPEGFSAADVSSLSVMTKDDLMSYFDEIITDPSITLARAEQHLETLKEGDAYLDSSHHVVASGGSSGRRGVFVWGWDAWTLGGAVRQRWTVRHQKRCGEAPGAGVTATVAADAPTHMTSAFALTFSPPNAVRFPVTLPLTEIVAGLNRVRPSTLYAYSSALAQLVVEAAAGRLVIRPKRVVTTAEPLLPEVRGAISAIWGAPVANVWGTSEGAAIGMGCYEAEGMHVSDDNVILEPVDERGKAAAPGSASAKVYLTNLINPLLPLIRYEITDEVTILPDACPCGSAFTRVADIQGRLDDVFRYGDVAVHPHVFRTALGSERSVVEYQVRQTPTGATVLLCCSTPPDLERLSARLADALSRAGLIGAHVELVVVDQIERQVSGKLKRFIAL